MMHDQKSLRTLFDSIGQGHVFAFWDSLNAGQREELLGDLAAVNAGQIPSLMEVIRNKSGAVSAHGALEPPRVIRRAEVDRRVRAIGEKEIAAGKVCAFTVAGGQGTRLGFDGPKGAFRISPVRNKPLFELFAEAIRATDKRYGCGLHWYIMTSPLNDEATRSYFEEQKYFGLNRDHVHFFVQGVMPAFDPQGKILLEEKHRLALSPDGHGGSLLAMANSGMLGQMKSAGIEHISYFQVDNPLVHPIDPTFVGVHVDAGSEMSSKTLSKADDLERVGNFVMESGRLGVIEYSDLPESLARARNADGTRKFDAANIAIHILSREFVERLTADHTSFALPWHRAEKKVPHVDLVTGQRVEPARPNGVKLEAFIFDALPLAARAVLLETSREEEFSPVKNATGVDSVETARRDMSRRAAQWLEQGGVRIPRDVAGEPDGVFEISSLRALDAEDLKLRGLNDIAPPSPGARLYIE